ncbi:hypothetical protein SEPCBS119000_004083 [Sporothrix epigloea]|uniref:Metal homeostatis protein bsd2 n=1 Tax=Sporothrix epigloea TaxID=1892477 RepID=A0ABP0DTX0_9PEZI
MSARYERVNAHDDNDDDDRHSIDNSNADGPILPNVATPDSPPPSFRSRASSRSPEGGRNRRHGPVDPALADAFGTDGDMDNDESDDNNDDDRQRLMRSRDALRPMRAPAWMTTPTSETSSDTSSQQTPSTSTATPPPTRRPASGPPSAAAPSRTGRVYGGGIQSDGVFSNITARPEPGEEKDELPPTYEQAAADAAPPYWETTILAPGLGGSGEVYVDGMPVGSVFSFVWNGMISMSFQVVGFLLTYLLHSTHAAKNGSRAGLGITLIQYGFYLKGSDDADGMAAAGTAATAGKSSNGFAAPPDPNAHNFDPSTVATGSGGAGDSSGDGGLGSSLTSIANSEWVAYLLMIVGWLILIKSVSDFLRARRHEQLVLQSPDRGLGVAVVAEGENPENVV